MLYRPFYTIAAPAPWGGFVGYTIDADLVDMDVWSHDDRFNSLPCSTPVFYDCHAAARYTCAMLGVL